MAGQLPFATWQFKLFVGASTHARSHIHAQQTQIFHTRPHTHAHTHSQSQLSLIRRRSEPSTAQFRNFYGKSSLIKFNELWKRQQISRGQLCCQSLSSLIFLMSRRHFSRLQSKISSSDIENLEKDLLGFDLVVLRCKLPDVIFVGWHY